MITGACLEPVAGRATPCGAPSAKPKAESAQQQPVKTIPAVAPEIFLRNSLRVGMFRFLCCCGAVVKLRGRDISWPHARAKTRVRPSVAHRSEPVFMIRTRGDNVRTTR